MKYNILIVYADFYEHISKMLLEGAQEYLKKFDYINYETIKVPGALEIPTAISMALNSNMKFDGYIALGCVIRGETTHYDYVCLESARGINDLAIKNCLPMGNGILTVENEEQAIARADKNKKDKGGFAAQACVEMLELKKYFKSI